MSRPFPLGRAKLPSQDKGLNFPDGLLERYTECIAAYLKSLNIRIKPSVPAQWRTPEVKWRQLNFAVERLEELRRSDLLDEVSGRARQDRPCKKTWPRQLIACAGGEL